MTQAKSSISEGEYTLADERLSEDGNGKILTMKHTIDGTTFEIIVTTDQLEEFPEFKTLCFKKMQTADQ